MSDALAQLQELGNELADAEAVVVRLKDELKAAEEHVERLTEKQIPALMDDLGIDELRLKSGFRVKVGDKMFGKQLTAANAAALKWLRENNQGGLISTLLGVPFAKGSEAEADALVERLRGEGIAVNKDVTVNAGSLKAVVRRLLSEGVDVPVETLGIHTVRVASLER